jgi:predicted nucleic acid-binding protein
VTPTAKSGAMDCRALVVDANILISAVLGRRVRHLIETYSNVALFLPRSALEEARRNLPGLAVKRKDDPQNALDMLDSLASGMELIRVETAHLRAEAKRRMKRDPSDWPILAVALEVGCPIWTDDRDFFGCGVATWTTANVEIYLDSPG